MQAERYARLRALHDQIADLAPNARAAALGALDVEPDLAAEVLALCEAGDRDHTGALSRVRDALLPDATAPQPVAGDRLGVWRIVDEIGHGGMGRVYRVERDDGSYAQTAALKFIKGLAGEAAVARFTRERQLLADLVHPNIARLLDGGASDAGQPYLVMAYVDGEPIDAYCGSHRPSLDALLSLFVATCAAVAQAHRQLVVHCDLKPTNILVTARGEPMLLDFGIAQLADRVADGVANVSTDAAAGYTPRYASPEQVRGERVGIASDIYSLGIVLREMLDAARIVPRRELAAILEKATSAAPGDRYASVDALCDDVARLRTHRPVQAMPATPAYRIARFVRRHWIALLVASGVFALSAGFTWKVVVESRRAQAAERIALEERDRARVSAQEARASEASARATAAFLTSVFEGANPDAGSGTVSIATLLDEALQRVERDLADQPATRAQLSATLADVLFLIGEIERGQALYREAIALERGQGRPLVLAQMLLDNASRNLRYLPAEVSLDEVREALSLVRTHANADSLQALDMIIAAASVLGNQDPAEAAPLLETALERMRELRPDSMALSDLLGAYGWIERRRGNHARAVTLMQDSAALHLRLEGDAGEDYATQLDGLAGTLSLARRFDEAEALFERAQALHQREGRMDSVVGAWSLAQRAAMLRDAGRPREALPLYDRILAIGARKLAPDDHTMLVWNNNRAGAMAAAGDPERAAALYGAILPKMMSKSGPDDYVTLRVQVSLARVRNWNDCASEGGAGVQSTIERLAALRAPDDAELAEARVVFAQWLMGCGRLDEAGRALSEASAHRAGFDRLQSLWLAQTEAALRLRRDGDAAALAAALAVERQARALFATGDPRVVFAAWPRLQWLQVQRRGSEATALAQSMLSELDGRLVPDSPWYARLRPIAAKPPADPSQP